MSRLFASIFVTVSLHGFAQPFKTDACGIVKESVFQEFAKKKGYVLVGAFRKVEGSGEELADVYNGSEWVRINTSGNEILHKPLDICGTEMSEIIYETVDSPSSHERQPVTGVFSQKSKKGYTYRDKQILPPAYDSIRRVDQCGLFFLKVKQNGRWGVADYQGKFIVPLIYEELTPAVGAFICKDKESFIVINRVGVPVLKTNSRIREENPGLFSWYASNYATNMADLYGHQVVIPPGGSGRGPKTDVLDMPDEMASFPGGRAEMVKFIMDNLRYPPNMAEICVSGRVYLKFVVGNDGKISDIVVQRGIRDCPECDKEAKRVVSIMPDWIPAKQYGRPVASYFNLPVKFEIGR